MWLLDIHEAVIYESYITASCISNNHTTLDILGYGWINHGNVYSVPLDTLLLMVKQSIYIMYRHLLSKFTKVVYRKYNGSDDFANKMVKFSV